MPCPLTQKIGYRVIQALTSGLLRAKLISIALCQIINICQETLKADYPVLVVCFCFIYVGCGIVRLELLYTENKRTYCKPI